MASDPAKENPANENGRAQDSAKQNAASGNGGAGDPAKQNATNGNGRPQDPGAAKENDGGESAAAGNSASDSPVWQARQLLRAARGGTLATSAKGQPFASLVTPACMPDGSLLLLLSRLAEHTRHLAADPRCSIMVTGAAETANPQTTPRVTVTGMAEVVVDPALKARYLAIHPYASLYADFGDFATWRIAPAAGVLVGGFARAFRLKAAELAPDPPPLRRSWRPKTASWRTATATTPTRLAAIAGVARRLAHGYRRRRRVRPGAGGTHHPPRLVRPGGGRGRGAAGTGADGEGGNRRLSGPPVSPPAAPCTRRPLNRRAE